MAEKCKNYEWKKLPPEDYDEKEKARRTISSCIDNIADDVDQSSSREKKKKKTSNRTRWQTAKKNAQTVHIK